MFPNKINSSSSSKGQSESSLSFFEEPSESDLRTHEIVMGCISSFTPLHSEEIDQCSFSEAVPLFFEDHPAFHEDAPFFLTEERQDYFAGLNDDMRDFGNLEEPIHGRYLSSPYSSNEQIVQEDEKMGFPREPQQKQTGPVLSITEDASFSDDFNTRPSISVDEFLHFTIGSDHLFDQNEDFGPSSLSSEPQQKQTDMTSQFENAKETPRVAKEKSESKGSWRERERNIEYLRRRRVYVKSVIKEAEIIKEKMKIGEFTPNEEEQKILRESIKFEDERTKHRERSRQYYQIKKANVIKEKKDGKSESERHSASEYIRNKSACEVFVIKKSETLNNKMEIDEVTPNEEEQKTFGESVKFENKKIKERERIRRSAQARRALTKNSISLIQKDPKVLQKIEEIRSKKFTTMQDQADHQKEAATVLSTTEDALSSDHADTHPSNSIDEFFHFTNGSDNGQKEDFDSFSLPSSSLSEKTEISDLRDKSNSVYIEECIGSPLPRLQEKQTDITLQLENAKENLGVAKEKTYKTSEAQRRSKREHMRRKREHEASVVKMARIIKNKIDGGGFAPNEEENSTLQLLAV